MEQKWNKNGGNMLSLVVVLCGCVPYFLVRCKIRHDCFFSRHRNQSSCLSLKVDLLALIVTVAVAMAWLKNCYWNYFTLEMLSKEYNCVRSWGFHKLIGGPRIIQIVMKCSNFSSKAEVLSIGWCLESNGIRITSLSALLTVFKVWSRRWLKLRMVFIYIFPRCNCLNPKQWMILKLRFFIARNFQLSERTSISSGPWLCLCVSKSIGL